MIRILTLAFIVFLAQSCSLKKSSLREKTKESVKSPAPNDYWFLKRSHEFLGYNEKKYTQEMLNTAAFRKNNFKDGIEYNLTWELEGPFAIGGRINVIKPWYRGSDTLLAGAANGGVFLSTNGGAQWTPIFDEFAYLSIGAIDVKHENIYVGTGDRNFGGYSYLGNGLFKSTDFGSTWTNIGLQNVGIITACYVHPVDQNTMVVGALGSGFEKTTQRGIFKTTDGGLSWTNTLFVSDSSGVTELVVHPTNPDIMYASTFNRVNLPDRGISRGPDSKLFKSIDGGNSWQEMTLPFANTGDLSRCGIALCESQPNRLYALFVGNTYNVAHIITSNDGGTTWNEIFPDASLDANALGGFGWYFGRIHVDPWNENHLIVPGVDQYESYDGGTSWQMNVPDWWTYEVHADKHDFYFIDAQTWIIATDGSLYKTTNAGNSWQPLGDLPITQFYHVNANPLTNGAFAGGAQDNGTTSGNQTSPWTRDFGGDGFYPTYLADAGGIAIYEVQRGGLYWTDAFGATEDISVTGENTNWNMPYFFSDWNSDMNIVAASDRVLLHQGAPFGSYVPVSDNLTLMATDPGLTPRYHNITSIEQDPFDETALLVGTSDGLVWRGNYASGATSFVDIKSTLPDQYVSDVTYSKLESNKLYLAMTGYYNNFEEALIYKSTDNGLTWTSIQANLPPIGVNCLITQVVQGIELILIGTDNGVFISEDDGMTWLPLGNGLPQVTISSLDIQNGTNRLIAGTFGRSMYSYDFNWYVGLKEQSINSIQISPNPVSNHIKTDGLNFPVSIYNVYGTLVKQISEPTEMITIQDLPDGAYILRTNQGSEQFIIQNKN